MEGDCKMILMAVSTKECKTYGNGQGKGKKIETDILHRQGPNNIYCLQSHFSCIALWRGRNKSKAFTI